MDIKKEQTTPIILPVIPLRGAVSFPQTVFHFEAGRKKTMIALNQALEENKELFLVCQREPEQDDPDASQLYQVGTVATVVQVMRTGRDVVSVVAEGRYRAKIASIVQESPFLAAEVLPYAVKKATNTLKNAAMIRSALTLFEEYIEMAGDTVRMEFPKGEEENLAFVTDYIASNVHLEQDVLQSLLEERSPSVRMQQLLVALEKEVQILSLENEIQTKVREQIDKGQREYYMREQIRVLSNELGDGENPLEEAEEYKNKIQALHLSQENEEKLLKESERLAKMPFGSHEATVIRNYLDTCLELPWNRYSKERIDLEAAQRILDRDHYGLKKVKERMLEMLSVRKLSPDYNGQIICLVGPPGVGKTSIARSIATALNREYVRVSLGGVHDEAEIRGHRRTYIGAMPGRIIKAVMQAKTANPLILLDEVDKLAGDFKGDPAAALLELLDAEQNFCFQDHYIDLPFDMSKVLFLTTANNADAIPAPLLDRMDVIELPSYTHDEKFQIAKKHLLLKECKRHGLNRATFKLTDGALHTLIDGYTREAGVRKLERSIASLCRKAARKIAAKETESVRIAEADLEGLLGPRKFQADRTAKHDEIGVVNGLAWTAVGGELMPVEVAVMDGTGKIELTGSLGDVMKESARTAISCVRAHAKALEIDSDFYKKYDIHIHVPEGAVPKDGPSAGVTMATAVVSALKGIPVRSDVAMTGEITLRGRVLPIGGLREKAMAAYRNGIRTVLIPKENEPNLYEVDEQVKKKVRFLPQDEVTGVLRAALRWPAGSSKPVEFPHGEVAELGARAPTYIAQKGEEGL